MCDNSLSPVETDIAEAMVFDPRMGGFGVEKPLLNRRFEVAREDRQALPQSAYVPDLCWPRARISIEYDSDLHHRGERDISRDAIRRNGIQQLGTRVITLTWAQASNYYEFERVATMVAKALGKRRSAVWDTWEPRRRELHRLLFAR
ncbi:endonuclease domain-containing protein [Arabiibacter massiliensis]|uniref:endonuclease domain-containing protein n=1 Tax=Arabiibacter massiliensis TaxID=1870985 RepID=UPI001E363C5C|nr:endonuclease domain-containing protein [Arabiibacter massiliensis]